MALLQLPLLVLILLLFPPPPSVLSASSLNSPCADQLQRCGVLVEEFERQLQDLKNLAFRNCFTNTACVHEKIAFDDCFAKSLRAVRAPFGENAVLTKNDFLTAAEDFRPEMEQCFGGGVLAGEESTGAGANGTALDSGEDISYLAPSVFGIELVDRLWGLPNGDLGKEQLMDPQGGCPSKDASSRVFGGGISRIVPPGADQLNNLNSSCTLTAPELACYRRALDHDPQYRLLMSSRDRALRSCLQNVRLQSEANCQSSPSPQLHSCICNSREQLNARMQSALLSCMQHSPVAQLYSALVGLSSGALPMQPLPELSTRFKPAASTGPPLPPTSLQISEEPVSLASSSSTGSLLTQGSIVSGQCLCACPRQKCQSSPISSSSSIAANNDYYIPSSQTRARLPPETGAAIVVPASSSQAQTYRAMPWYYQPVQTALSAEAGIANGFERFFNGQPPLKRKKRAEKGGK